MNTAKLRTVTLTTGFATLLMSHMASAQDATAGGQVGMGLPGATGQTAPAAPAGGTDHSLFVGHLGVGYLGLATLGVGAPGAPGQANVDAPVIGVRYWMNPDMGLDLGLGLGIDGGSNDPANDPPSHWAIVLHGGVPLALGGGRHYTFEVIPEANIGFGGGSATMGGTDISNKGFALDLGARAGAEIQFGFIGLPELALQGSIGAKFSIASASSTPDGGTKTSVSSYRFGTNVYANPWAIFTNTVSALYYF